MLRSYCGTQYRYDERGNLLERIENGKAGHFTWDLYNRLRRYEDDRLIVSFAYDALGRRLYKNSRAKYRDRPQAGPLWNENARRQRDEELGCGFTWFTWDGDTLATECRDQKERGGSTTHYVFEPGTFIPVAQAVTNTVLDLLPQPLYGDHYSIDRDPIWLHKPKAGPIDAFVWYQCDKLGTPMELTDEDGRIAWSGVYKSWGFAKEKRSDKARFVDIGNQLRFQGQHFDIETNFHYNRHRYYDPRTGRFIGKDPIGYAGSLNLYSYAPNPLDWIDPYGLAKNRGRIQAQGAKLEESVSWNQDTPVTAADGKRMLTELKGKLSGRDLNMRSEAFTKAERYIDDACKCGGVSAQASKSFKVRDTKGERVDIEVITGSAFEE